MQSDYTQRYKDIGERIAYYRQKRGFSQRELARKTNFSEEYINRIETYGADEAFANKSPWSNKSMNTLLTIADALEVESVVFFLPMTEEYFEKYRTDK